jgi:hypothetical protein
VAEDPDGTGEHNNNELSHAGCYKLGLGNRTVYDKLVVVLQLFKRYGKTRLITSNDWPEYVEKIRPIYEPEEIEAMLGVATESERVFLKFLVGSTTDVLPRPCVALGGYGQSMIAIASTSIR